MMEDVVIPTDPEAETLDRLAALLSRLETTLTATARTLDTVVARRGRILEEEASCISATCHPSEARHHQ